MANKQTTKQNVIPPISFPNVNAYGTNYKLYMEHYKLARAFVEDMRAKADALNKGRHAAKKALAAVQQITAQPSKGKQKAAAPKTLTPAQEEGRKAHKKFLNRQKKERRKLRKLEAQVKIAELEKKLAGAGKAKAQASLAATKAKAEVPLLATKVEVAKGVYANAKAAATRDAIRLDKERIQQAAQRDAAVIQHDTALNKAAVQLEESRIRLQSAVNPSVQLGQGVDATPFTKALLQFGSIKFDASNLAPSQAFRLQMPMPVSVKGLFNYRIEQLAQEEAARSTGYTNPNQTATTQTTHYDTRGRITGTTVSVRT